MMSPEEIKDKVQSVTQLPVLPAVARDVVRLLDDPNTSASSLSKVIAADQALTAKVLKIANSPFYGFPRKISTIDFAIIVLGFDALKEIVVSIALVNSLHGNGKATPCSQAFARHGVATGLLGQQLARDTGYRVSGEVFVGGLLHDMGICIMRNQFKNEYDRIVDIARSTDLTFQEAEESVLGVTHAEVGGWLAERWNLPEHLVETLTFHHCPSKASKNPEMAALVHCADVFVRRIAGPSAEFDKGSEFDPDALGLLRLNDMGKIDQCVAAYGPLVEGRIGA